MLVRACTLSASVRCLAAKLQKLRVKGLSTTRALSQQRKLFVVLVAILPPVLLPGFNLFFLAFCCTGQR